MNPGAAPVAVAAICSTCDDGMDATSYLKYYGSGEVRVTWTVDGVQSQQNIAIGPSQPRHESDAARVHHSTRLAPFVMQIPIPEPPIIISQSSPIYSPALQVSPVGNHTVMVQADVLPQPPDAKSFHRDRQGAGFADADGTGAEAGSSGSGAVAANKYRLRPTLRKRNRC